MIGLLSALLLTLSRTLSLGFTWGRTADAVLGGKVRANHLSAALVEALRQGAPIEALAIGPRGHVHEQPVPDAQVAWDEGALILAREAAYTVIVQEGAQVVRHDLDLDGRVVATPLVSGVERLEIEAVRVDDELRGIAYRLSFVQGGPPIEGFVGLRTEARGRTTPWPQPTPAPRYGGAR